jgi:sugar lactone lactonase YvrE
VSRTAPTRGIPSCHPRARARASKGRKGRSLVTAALAAAVLLATDAVAVADTARPRWQTDVFALIGPPGFPALPHVMDGRVYEGTYTNPAGDDQPSRVREFTGDGTLLRSWTITDQDLSAEHGIQVTGHDSRGRLVLNDRTPARTLLLDPNTGAQSVYATYADLPQCSPLEATTACSDSVTDQPPMPDVSAWGPDGSLYTTDFQQAVIWRVPPGGGSAEVWSPGPALDGVVVGTAGIALAPDHRSLLVAQSASRVGNPTTGRVFSVPIQPDGRPGPITTLWQSRSGDAPDGLAVAASGRIYLALVSPSANQLAVLDPSGTELERFPTVPATGNNGSPIPFDGPSGVAFRGSELLVANQSFVTGNAAHQAVLEVATEEPGLPIFVPPNAGLHR